MIYLYGLYDGVPSEIHEPLALHSGLQAPLEFAEINGWTLIYSEHDDAEILPKRRLLLAHTKLLEAILPKGAVLPARFGLVATDLAQVRDLILSQSDLIEREFAKIRNAIEIGVRIRFPKKEMLEATMRANPNLMAEREKLGRKGPEAHFEIAEFGGRLAEQVDRRRAAAQKIILNELRTIARDHVLRAPEDDTEVLRAEFMIDRAYQADFQAAIQQAVKHVDFAQYLDPEIQIVGPVPMYNFVRLNLSFENSQAAA